MAAPMSEHSGAERSGQSIDRSTAGSAEHAPRWTGPAPAAPGPGAGWPGGAREPDLCAVLAGGASLDDLLAAAVNAGGDGLDGRGPDRAELGLAAEAGLRNALGDVQIGNLREAGVAPPVRASGTPVAAPGPVVRVWEDQTVSSEGDGAMHLVCPYWLEVVEDHACGGAHLLLCRVVRPNGAPIPLQLPAEALGDSRRVKSALAGAMGAAFRAPFASLDRCVAAWLSASTPRTSRSIDAFGFTANGQTFVDVGRCLPEGELRFIAPPGSPAVRLGLRTGDAVATMRRLLTLWPQVVGCPATVAALLGLVGWALVAPVLEASDPSISPLIVMLNGPTGAGKSTHAGVAQCFFGDFAHARAAVPFSSTPLSIEAAAQRFGGALMVVGDVKASAITPRSRGAITSLLQRAGDRGTRQRLDATGAQGISSQSRATLLLEGEDLPTAEGSSIARMLLLRLPVAARQPTELAALMALLHALPAATEGLVLHLLSAQPWAALLQSHRDLVAALCDGSPEANAARVARSVAAICVGAEVWRSWLGLHGLCLPADIDSLQALLLRTADDQLDELSAATPAARLLVRLRELIDAGRAHVLGVGEPSGLRVGRCAGEGILELFPNVTVNFLNQNAGPDEPTLAVRSAGAALQQAGALLERTGAHYGRRVRVEGNLTYVWRIAAVTLLGDPAGVPSVDDAVEPNAALPRVGGALRASLAPSY